jgi:3'(2'), 5'-bisphosphate nucleotidase
MADSSHQQLADIIRIAQRAGEAILEIYQGDFDIQRKDDHTPLTEADLRAHDILLQELRRLTPDIPVLSEESQPIPYAERRQWQRYWLIDPLDGTREFISKTGEFTVNIALIDGDSSVLGVVHLPTSNTTYYAASGHGAYKRNNKQAGQRLRARKSNDEHFIVTTSQRAKRDRDTASFLNNLPSYELLTMGSAIKSCLVAEGRADIYPRIGPTSEWDTAAAQIIVEEAGGKITDLEMRPLRYNTKESLLNPDFVVIADHSIDWEDYLAAITHTSAAN